MIILYDAKCSFCQNLAYKIHFDTEGAVSIRALSDPAAVRILESFYPNGWAHDFYVVDGDVCRRGLRAFPALLRSLRARRVASLVGEYATFKVNGGGGSSCGGRERGTSRRDVLKYAALTPVVYGLSKVPRLATRSSERLPRGSGRTLPLWRATAPADTSRGPCRTPGSGALRPTPGTIARSPVHRTR